MEQLIYVKFKTCFREQALRRLKGPKLSVFLCFVLHMDRTGTTAPGIERIMRETGLSRGAVCSALKELASPSLCLIARVPDPQDRSKQAFPCQIHRYRIRGYAWCGSTPAPALYEEEDIM